MRYELVDSHNPTWRGQRFASLERALREWDRSVPAGRFYVKDRTTGEVLTSKTSIPTY